MGTKAIVEYRIDVDKNVKAILNRHGAYWSDVFAQICAVSAIIGFAAVGVSLWQALMNRSVVEFAKAQSRAAGKNHHMLEVSSLEQVTEVFKFIDVEEKGYIDSPLLRLLAQLCQVAATEEELDEVMEELQVEMDKEEQPTIMDWLAGDASSKELLGGWLLMCRPKYVIPEEAAVHWAWSRKESDYMCDGVTEATGEMGPTTGADAGADAILHVPPAVFFEGKNSVDATTGPDMQAIPDEWGVIAHVCTPEHRSQRTCGASI